jgi:hypothetical protein
MSEDSDWGHKIEKGITVTYPLFWLLAKADQICAFFSLGFGFFFLRQALSLRTNAHSFGL